MNRGGYRSLLGDSAPKKIWAAVGISALAHVLLAAGFATFHIKSGKRSFYAPVQMVNLVEAPAPEPAPPPKTVKAKAPKTVVKKKPAKKAVPKQKPQAAKPVKKEAIPIPVEKAAPKPVAEEPEVEYTEEHLSERLSQLRSKFGAAEEEAPEETGEPRGDVSKALEAIRKKLGRTTRQQAVATGSSPP